MVNVQREKGKAPEKGANKRNARKAVAAALRAVEMILQAGTSVSGMKRRREEQIMIEALREEGIQDGLEIRRAVASGLKRIRREKYAERKRARDAYSLSKTAVKAEPYGPNS